MYSARAKHNNNNNNNTDICASFVVLYPKEVNLNSVKTLRCIRNIYDIIII